MLLKLSARCTGVHDIIIFPSVNILKVPSKKVKMKEERFQKGKMKPENCYQGERYKVKQE